MQGYDEPIADYTCALKTTLIGRFIWRIFESLQWNLRIDEECLSMFDRSDIKVL